MTSAKHWISVSTSLAITKEAVNPSFIHDTLKIDYSLAGHGCHINSGTNWWAYTYDGSAAPTLDEQISLLVGQVRPRLERLAVLLQAGHHVQVAIAGSVETGSQLFIPPPSIEQLTSLNLPVSFTTLTSTGLPEEDPLGWLDD
ncbi:hypothetical protein ACTU45_09345 [Streptomyces sp. 24-1644]|uniref:hypothetical protein n=1 Tax=Streptomyces sp. 24-1644 TaxID=3457315 RepID=UPI003FA705DD